MMLIVLMCVLLVLVTGWCSHFLRAVLYESVIQFCLHPDH
jgi:hypothetical protein